MSPSWTLVYEKRPPTMNAYRSLHFHQKGKLDREWREAFAWRARAARIPKLDRVLVTAAPVVASRRSLPDVGACFPAVKAAIDGLVDAGVIPDDTPEHVGAITFVAPEVEPGGVERLLLVVQVDDL